MARAASATKLQTLSTINDLDSKILQQYAVLRDTFTELRMRELRRGEDVVDWFKKTIIHIGSSAEGTHVARWFKDGVPFIETDFMFPIGDVSLLEDKAGHSQIETIPDRVGAYMIRNDYELINCIHPFVREKWQETAYEFRSRNAAESSSSVKWLSADIVKYAMQKLIKFRDNDKDINHVASNLLGHKIKNVKDDTKIEGPSANVSLQLCDASDRIVLNFAADIVICFRIDEWPSEALSWFDRKSRKWPSVACVEGIRHIPCHVVPKSSPRETDAKLVALQWRISFVAAEKVLASNQTQYQRIIYLILKLIHYQHLKDIEGEKEEVSSYLMKTTFFWCLEETEMVFWKESNIKENLSHVFDKYMQFVRDRKLPHYIMTSINLLERYSQNFLENLEKRLIALKTDDLLVLLDAEKLSAVIVMATKITGLLDMLTMGVMFTSAFTAFKQQTDIHTFRYQPNN